MSSFGDISADKSGYKLHVLMKEGKIQGLQGESGERSIMTFTSSVYIQHRKSLGKKPQDKAMLCFAPEVSPGFTYIFGFPGRTKVPVTGS